MLATPNTILAAIAIAAGLLAARGFLPHLDFWGRTASGYLARGLVISAFSAFPRMFVWDVLWWSHRDLVAVIGAAPINTAANAILLVGLWHVLKARHLSIPVEYRDQYNILTAPFYPGRLSLKEKWRRK